MEETRVDKYKDYRNKLIREGASNIETPREKKSDINTQTLPMDEVYESLEEKMKEEEDLIALERKKTILKYSFIGAFLVLLLVAIIIAAIAVFRH